jgi:hypothetical protein
MAAPLTPPDQIEPMPTSVGIAEFRGSAADTLRARRVKEERLRKLAFWRRFKRPR